MNVVRFAARRAVTAAAPTAGGTRARIGERALPAGFEDFYRAEFGSVFDASYAFCGKREVALDATQEAFSRAFVRWSRLSRESWAGGWVMTTAMNLCKKYARRVQDRTPPATSSTADDPQSVVERMDLSAAIRQLPSRQREAVLLHYLGDYPVAVVADLMRVSEGAVKRHLFRAREGLKSSLSHGDQ